ncbi:MAG: hypothetical protein ACKO0V_18145 [bacterium]
MSAIKASVVSSPAAAARNAVRHGLSGSHYVPDHARDHVAAILRDIEKQFRAAFHAEKAAAEEMALCRWQVFEADRLLDERHQIEIAEAGKHYDKFLETEQADFLNVLAHNPARGISLLKHNLYGNEALIATWTEIRHLVDLNLPFSTEILRQMVAALGSHWQLDKISHQALVAVALCLSGGTHPDDAELIANAWVREIDPELADFAARRLGEYRKRFGQEPDAQAQLIAMIDDKLSELKALKDRLEAGLDHSIANFATAHAGQGMRDPLLIKEIGLLQRYRTRALNRITRLELQIAKGRTDELTSLGVEIRSELEDREGMEIIRSMRKPVAPPPQKKPDTAPSAPARPPLDPSYTKPRYNFTPRSRNKPSTPATVEQKSDVIPVPNAIRESIEAPTDYAMVNLSIGG